MRAEPVSGIIGCEERLRTQSQYRLARKPQKEKYLNRPKRRRGPPPKKQPAAVRSSSTAPMYEHASDSDFEWDLDPSRHQRQQPRPQPIPQERPEPRRATEPTSKQSDYLDNEDGERPAVRVVEAASEEAIANQSDLQLVFFGTSARQSTAARSASAIALRKGKSNWLFDCGEDTQRQLLKQALVRPGKIDRMFITRAAGDTTFGLPGMICICSAAREMGLDTSDMPLQIYGPPGLAEYLRTFLTLSDTYVVMPIVVNEFVTHSVPEEDLERPQQLEQRCCLFRQPIPPDQLNPQGYFDGAMVQLTKRHQQRRKKRKGPDERAIITGQRLPGPGDPSRTGLQLEEMTWTVRCDESMTVTSVPLSERPAAFGYLVRESDRAGSLNVAKCEELRVRPGKNYARLKLGESVLNEDGIEVLPEQVVGPTIIGRSLAILGAAAMGPAAAAAAGCDLLVHPAAVRGDEREETACAESAAAIAKQAGARHLVLTGFPEGTAVAGGMQFSSFYADREEGQSPRGAPMLDFPPTAGTRHVNAALGRLRSGNLVDPFAEKCVEVAQKEIGSNAVTAAADLMVVSVERRS